MYVDSSKSRELSMNIPIAKAAEEATKPTPQTSNGSHSPPQKKEVCRDKTCLRDTPCGHKRCDFPGSGE